VNAVRVTVYPPRCWVAGLRVHHAVTGLALMCWGLARGSRGLFVAGVALVLEDWRDWWWSPFS
jgi:hypothetical protein